MNAREPIEMAFFHPNTSTWAVITFREAAHNSPTARVHVSIRNPRGVEAWRSQRWISTWQKWAGRVWKGEEPGLPVGWYPCEPDEVPF